LTEMRQAGDPYHAVHFSVAPIGSDFNPFVLKRSGK
jgi:hypothetical protein